MKRATLVVLLAAGCSLAIHAQSPAKKQQVSTVTGHVFYADTNTPARLATVLLQPVGSPTAPAASSKNPSVEISSVQTSIDGSFSFAHVAPGSYYVLASSPGYMTALASLGLSRSDLQSSPKAATAPANDPAPKQTELNAASWEKLLARLPKVAVQANLPAALDVSLERGAAVTGTVLYDDGSPAAGLVVSVLIHKKEKWQPLEAATSPYSADIKTDDRGSYRVAGLAPGEYLVSVSLSMESVLYQVVSGPDGTGGASMMNSGPPYTLPTYSGGVFRTKEAAPFKVKAGDERPGEDIQISLSKLHVVSGSVLAARDGHLVNGGKVSLENADDRSSVAEVRLSRDQPGFSFSFIPEGDYILDTTGSSDIDYEEVANAPGNFPPTRVEEHTTHRYGSAEQRLHVEGNVSGLTIAVPEQPATTHSAQ